MTPSERAEGAVSASAQRGRAEIVSPTRATRMDGADGVESVCLCRLLVVAVADDARHAFECLAEHHEAPQSEKERPRARGGARAMPTRPRRAAATARPRSDVASSSTAASAWDASAADSSTSSPSRASGGFCPSCLGRRMADTALHLVDKVIRKLLRQEHRASAPPPRCRSQSRRATRSETPLSMSSRCTPTPSPSSRSGRATAAAAREIVLSLNERAHDDRALLLSQYNGSRSPRRSGRDRRRTRSAGPGKCLPIRGPAGEREC